MHDGTYFMALKSVFVDSTGAQKGFIVLFVDCSWCCAKLSRANRSAGTRCTCWNRAEIYKVRREQGAQEGIGGVMEREPRVTPLNRGNATHMEQYNIRAGLLFFNHSPQCQQPSGVSQRWRTLRGL